MSSEGNEGEGCCVKETKPAQASNQGFGHEGTKKKRTCLSSSKKPKNQIFKNNKKAQAASMPKI